MRHPLLAVGTIAAALVLAPTAAAFADDVPTPDPIATTTLLPLNDPDVTPTTATNDDLVPIVLDCGDNGLVDSYLHIDSEAYPIAFEVDAWVYTDWVEVGRWIEPGQPWATACPVYTPPAAEPVAIDTSYDTLPVDDPDVTDEPVIADALCSPQCIAHNDSHSSYSRPASRARGMGSGEKHEQLSAG